jgi:hypothetical protein
MQSSGSSKAAISRRITDEMREFSIVAAYLWICFTALAYLKAAILQAHGINFAPFAFAAIKALICGKFVLVGRALHIGERFKAQALIWPTLHRSLAFLALLIVLNVLEEVVVGVIHHRTIADSLADLGGGTLDQLIATSVVVLLILIPYFAFRSLGEVVGEDNLARLFFERRRRVDNA